MKRFLIVHTYLPENLRRSRPERCRHRMIHDPSEALPTAVVGEVNDESGAALVSAGQEISANWSSHSLLSSASRSLR